MQMSGGPYPIGQRFGPYQLESYLGGGAYKSVYRAASRESGDAPPIPSTVALGFPHHQDSEGIAELEVECEMASLLEHPQILRVYRVERAGGIAFMVMDYVEGQSLRALLRGGALPTERAIQVARQICEALAYAHARHVFHRDVKPENILIARDGRPLLLDFGVARLLTRTSEKRDTQVGTVDYMPPEMFHGAAGVNADLWALGVVLYEMLTGARPFTGEVGEVISKISSQARHDETPLQARGIDIRLVRVLRKALAKDPERRYARAEEFARDLEIAARGARFVEDDESRLEVLLKASIPLIYLVSSEEDRALAAVRNIALRLGSEANRARPLLVWSASRGLLDENERQVEPKTAGEPTRAIYHILEDRGDSIYVFLDLHRHLTPPVVRLLRDAARVVRSTRKSLVMLSPIYSMPDELQHEITLALFQLPDREHLEDLTERVTEQLAAAGLTVDLPSEARATLARATLGLTSAEAERAIRLAAVEHEALDARAIRSVVEQKSQLIRKSGLLEYYHTTESFADVAGLQNLLVWFRERQPVFAGTAQYAGLRAPRGVLLVGLPGCGKSLAARALAGSWGAPLLRLDIGRLFGAYVGESEANLRRAIQMAEAVSPCLLWIDEIEKGFAGTQGQGGGGVGARVFGAFLTWLQDKRSPVFVIATANDIQGLPPEFLRQGRFDDIFFVGLPGEAERRAAWRIHLEKRRRSSERYDLELLVAASDRFSGAEIEQTVIAGLFRAFSASRDLMQEDLLAAAAETHPLAVTQQRQMAALAAWGRAHALDAGASAGQ